MTTPPGNEDSAAMVSTTYRVLGMTCGHCAAAVTEELSAVDGVSTVSVDLAPGGTSTVTVAGVTRLADGLVAAALEEAGDYRLVDGAG
jgi:copper chaperone